MSGEAGKGSKPRKINVKKYEKNFEGIDWTKRETHIHIAKKSKKEYEDEIDYKYDDWD